MAKRFRIEMRLTLTCDDDLYTSWEASGSEWVKMDVEHAVRHRPRVPMRVLARLGFDLLVKTVRMRRARLRMLRGDHAR